MLTIRGTVRTLAASLLLSVVFCTALGPRTLSAAVPEVERHMATVFAQRDVFWAARRTAEATRLEQKTLSKKIARLKEQRSHRPLLRPRELERLLQQSVEQERMLELQLDVVRSERDALQGAIRSAVRSTDAHIRSLLPSMKAGAPSKQNKIAHEIQWLRKRRTQLRQWFAETQKQDPLAKTWSRYQVKVNDLDGPGELREKADFVEDTKDKFEKKRLALIAMLTELQEDRKLREVTRSFTRDVRHFDERVRGQRVLKGRTRSQGSAEASDAPRGTAATPNASPQAAPSSDQVATPVAEDSTTGFTTSEAAPPPNAQRDSGTGSTGGGAEENNTVTRIQSGPAPKRAQNDRQGRTLNPERLLNIKIESLRHQNLDERDLGRMINDLERLERLLSKQAKQIRQRAQKLEAEEKP